MSNRAEKLVKLRIFDNPATGKPWDSNVLECGYGCLLVSQVSNHSNGIIVTMVTKVTMVTIVTC